MMATDDFVCWLLLAVLGCVDAWLFFETKVPVNFYLYHGKQYIGNYTVINVGNVPDVFDPTGVTYFVIHGWTMKSTDLATLRRELGKKGAPIIMVDWRQLAKNINYVAACEDTDKVGKEVAKFIRGLEDTTGADRSRMHVIGFSLGGKVSAATASHLGKRKLMRITGLDTPLYCGSILASWGTVLDPDDAMFVDTIRTSFLSGVFGQKQGHADFWTCQNLKCVDMDVSDMHYEAVFLFANSINDPQCRIRCRACPSRVKWPLGCIGHENRLGFTTVKPAGPTAYYSPVENEYCKEEH